MGDFKNGGGFPLAFRRQQMSMNQPLNALAEMEAHLIGKFSFEGRSNDDADRSIVLDQSNGGSIMTLYLDSSWGKGDDYTKTGYYDDALCLAEKNAYVSIQLPQPIKEEFTIIAHRMWYNLGGFNGSRYSSLIGSSDVRNASSSPIYLEYKGDSISTPIVSRSAFAIYNDRVESPIAWLTPNMYNNREMGATTEEGEVQTLYLGRLRANIAPNSMPRVVLYSLHIFKKTYSPDEIAAYIRGKILPDYQLP